MGVPPTQAIIVADKFRDILVAEKLGCKSIAITGKLDISGDFKFTNVKHILRMLEVS